MHVDVTEEIVSHDDAQLEAYLEGTEPSAGDLERGFAREVAAGEAVPVIVCSGVTGTGVDRVADLLILGGLGLGLGHPGLGFAAAALAVMTAYVRELGRAIGAAQDFAGPMAKQHRMAVVTGAAVLAAFWPFGPGGWLLVWALWIVVAGCALTIARRSWRLVRWLRR